MTLVLFNDIQRQINIRHTSSEDRQQVLDRIRDEVFHSRDKKLTRVLNNTSQPTLEEAAQIAYILGVTIDDLTHFKPVEAA